MAFQLIGESSNRVEADHLDRSCGLMRMRASMLERRNIARRRLECSERFECAVERLIDLALHPSQGTKIEVGGGIDGHGRCHSPVNAVRVGNARSAPGSPPVMTRR